MERRDRNKDLFAEMLANVADVLELQLRTVEEHLGIKQMEKRIAEYSNQELADALTQTEAAIEKHQKELDELAGGRGDAVEDRADGEP